MEERHLLGIDIGTGSLKITIIDENANVIVTKSQEYELSHPIIITLKLKAIYYGRHLSTV